MESNSAIPAVNILAALSDATLSAPSRRAPQMPVPADSFELALAAGGIGVSVAEPLHRALDSTLPGAESAIEAAIKSTEKQLDTESSQLGFSISEPQTLAPSRAAAPVAQAENQSVQPSIDAHGRIAPALPDARVVQPSIDAHGRIAPAAVSGGGAAAPAESGGVSLPLAGRTLPHPLVMNAEASPASPARDAVSGAAPAASLPVADEGAIAGVLRPTMSSAPELTAVARLVIAGSQAAERPPANTTVAAADAPIARPQPPETGAAFSGPGRSVPAPAIPRAAELAAVERPGSVPPQQRAEIAPVRILEAAVAGNSPARIGAARPQEATANRGDLRLDAAIQAVVSPPETRPEVITEHAKERQQVVRERVADGAKETRIGLPAREVDLPPAQNYRDAVHASFDKAAHSGVELTDSRHSVEHVAQRADARSAINVAYPGIELAARPGTAGPAGLPPAAGPDFTSYQSVVTDQLGARLVSMSTGGQSVAKLQLQPAELGALEIRISMHDDGAVVSIHAQQPHARDAIEAGLPRLREMFAATGNGLIDVDISGDDGGSADGRFGAASRSAPRTTMQSPVNETLSAAPSGAPRADRLLDLYA